MAVEASSSFSDKEGARRVEADFNFLGSIDKKICMRWKHGLGVLRKFSRCSAGETCFLAEQTHLIEETIASKISLSA